MNECNRCKVLEDLLETARVQVEHARIEAEKADDEAMELKKQMLHERMVGSRKDYALIKQFERRAILAEQKLKAIEDATDGTA